MKSYLVIVVTIFLFACGKDGSQPTTPAPTPPPPATNDVDFWLTKGDQSVLLQKQNTVLAFGTVFNNSAFIEVDAAQTFQSVDGFGYTLTGGSVQVINQLTAAKKQALLQDIFGAGPNDIGVSYLRISIGASDLNEAAFTYDDMPAGQTDAALTKFNFGIDSTGLIPMLKEILLINPAIKILATPWSAPAWMKTNTSLIGGSLQTQYYSNYANYFVKYLQQMKLKGISVDAITPQNEPLNPYNNPSMSMTAVEQGSFIKNNLGPALLAANLTTKIITYDHNCDVQDYPISILNDPAANSFINGSAFHLYAGDISAMSAVHNAYPTKNVYFTEQFTSSTGDFGGDLKWHLKNVIIGSMRNWSKNALEWNLANDGTFGPHTAGGCTTCKGAITVESSSTYSKNVAYYIVAHVSKFVPFGSIRIGSNLLPNINNVAFKTPGGKIVLVVANDGGTLETFKIKFNGSWVTTSLASGAVGTYIW